MATQTSRKETVGMIALFITALGLADSVYLTIEHFAGKLPTCTVSAFVDCGQVLRSSYAVIFGVPLSLLGVLQYATLFVLLFAAFYTGHLFIKRLILLQTAIGFVFSLYLVFLQLVIIKAICLFCMGSALVSFVLYFLVRYLFSEEYRSFIPVKIKLLYQMFGKPAFFILDPEFVHDNAMRFGNLFGKVPMIRMLLAWMLRYDNTILKQKVAGLAFDRPLGLAAGYDYTASFPQILPSIGFGFQTIGTITNLPCEGNDRPRLGRLKESKSIMVNKGFRNPGADKIIAKLDGQKFTFPVGISIGVTNTASITKEDEAITDIVQAFQKFENSKVRHAFYELNISCPNLKTKVSFYEPTALKKLLSAVAKLRIKKPIFIKMPIDKKDEDVRQMLKVIIEHKIEGVIFGNLQKDRKDPAFVKEEVSQWKTGNFSGKPTFERSNHLIKLAYQLVGKKLIIVGCGGIFSGEDAYTKIKNGATLIQMITGMIFEGPQVVGQINRDIVQYLKADGYKKISEAVGVDSSN